MAENVDLHGRLLVWCGWETSIMSMKRLRSVKEASGGSSPEAVDVDRGLENGSVFYRLSSIERGPGGEKRRMSPRQWH